MDEVYRERNPGAGAWHVEFWAAERKFEKFDSWLVDDGIAFFPLTVIIIALARCTVQPSLCYAIDMKTAVCTRVAVPDHHM
jgi:hypothetical protein